MSSVTVLAGDVRDKINEIPNQSVQCVVTSPPYFGLRDYGTAQWEGGDTDCDHKIPASTLGGGNNKGHNGSFTANYGATCGKCGATRADKQIGLEASPQAYVDEMVKVFREVRRVLKDDGTLWLNLGDSYAGYWGDKTAKAKGIRSSADTNGWTNGFNMNARPSFHEAFDGTGIKPKDLIGIPWRVAFALQADGWYLRQDIIWSKPNPMPESVKDRCTKSHEYLFLLTKSPRYYYNAEAIAEPSVRPGDVQTFGGRKGSNYVPAVDDPNFRNGSEQWGRTVTAGSSRNRRSVWTVATRPYKEAHFAVFPPQLIEPCILAGSREGDIVLDPFAGSGTTLEVSMRLGRKCIGIELNPEYLPLIHKRTMQRPLVTGDAHQ